jgi:hypothetical protein
MTLMEVELLLRSHLGNITSMIGKLTELLKMMSNRYQTSTLQSRLANKGACTALIKRIIRHVAQKDEASVDCVERLGWALSSILLMGACHDRLECKSAFGLCVRVCMYVCASM